MKKNYLIQFFVIIVLVFMTQPSFATDGYFSFGYGTRSKGMAGAGVAMYSTSLIGGNPAGNVFLGNEFSFGIAAFSPDRQYTVLGNPTGAPYFGLTPGTVSSDKPFFFLPSVGGNWMINKTSAFGFSIYANGGGNTSYPTKTFDDPRVEVTSPTGINFSQLFSQITYSVKIAKNHAIGISAIGAFQMFEAEGLQAFSGLTWNPEKLTNNDLDNSYGYGGKIGYLGKITKQLSLGLNYQSQIFMTEFKEYAGLLAEQGDFDIPSNWTVGLAYQFSRSFALAVDVKQIRYTDVKAISNPITDAYYLGDENGPGFGWQNMMIFKLGMELASSRTLIWRAGYSYGLQQIPESQMLFNILSPGVSQSHAAAGFTKILSKKKKAKNAVNFSAMYSPAKNITGPNNMDPAQSIELKMSQFELELGFTF